MKKHDLKAFEKWFAKNYPYSGGKELGLEESLVQKALDLQRRLEEVREALARFREWKAARRAALDAWEKLRS